MNTVVEFRKNGSAVDEVSATLGAGVKIRVARIPAAVAQIVKPWIGGAR